jgi:hypothetical protein
VVLAKVVYSIGVGGGLLAVLLALLVDRPRDPPVRLGHSLSFLALLLEVIVLVYLFVTRVRDHFNT